MKEFSQKYSVVLLWTTIILLIISITLSVCAFSGKNVQRDFNGEERGGMMQNGGRAMNSNGFRNFNKNNVSNNQDTTQTSDQAPVPTPTATDTVTQ